MVIVIIFGYENEFKGDGGNVYLCFFLYFKILSVLWEFIIFLYKNIKNEIKFLFRIIMIFIYLILIRYLFLLFKRYNDNDRIF